MTEETREQKLVARLAESAFREQRARRRWGVFFRILFFGYVFALTAAFFTAPPAGWDDFATDTSHAAVIDISGVIQSGGVTDSLEINEALRDAFNNDSAKGIILRINSPGGSPVESNRIYREVRRLRKLHPDKKVYAVAGDICASGGYYIAAAADEIYVDENTLIGSIGVILAGFGFTEAMEKIGVERRVHTAGQNKNMLDPFSPADAADSERIEIILDSVYETFAAAVREGRGGRISENPEVFSGEVFSGTRSIALGMADGIGDTGYVAREIIGVEEIVFYNATNVFDSFIERFGARFFAAMYRAPVLQ